MADTDLELLGDAKQIKIDYSKYRGELQRLERQHGILSPQSVVDEARAEDSYLHNAFNWDDSDAAEKFRKIQARLLMTAVKVHVNGSKTGAFVNVRVIVDNTPTRGYISTTRAISDQEMRKQLFEQAVKELEHWQGKYNLYEELQGIIDQDELEKLKSK